MVSFSVYRAILRLRKSRFSKHIFTHAQKWREQFDAISRAISAGGQESSEQGSTGVSVVQQLASEGKERLRGITVGLLYGIVTDVKAAGKYLQLVSSINRDGFGFFVEQV